MTLQELTKQMREEADKKIATAEHDYIQARFDCAKGLYDKWFFNNREDRGRAYDLGWTDRNETKQNEKVTFIND